MEKMKDDNLAATGEEPPSDHRLQRLKEFRSAGRGFWHDVSDADWNDWRWQLKHRITTPEQLQRLMPTLTPEEFAGAKLANHKLALAITPYFFNLIDPADENCPIRRQVIPRVEETHTAPWEMSDPVRRGFALARARSRASLSRPRAVSGHRPLRGVLPLLHALAARQQRQRLRFSSRIRQADRIHRAASRNPRRAVERRRPAAVERRQAGKSFEPAARDSARGIFAHRLAHPDVSAATHHAGTVRDAEESFIRCS